MSSWITSDWAEEIRQLWNNYDPIGVYSFKNQSDWPKDEYDSYHGIIIKHLNSGTNREAMFKDIKYIVTNQIGMTWNEQLKTDTHNFVLSVENWFESKQQELKKTT